MNLLDELDNLRRKPEPNRRRFAVVGAFGFTFLMFVGWVLYMASGAAFDEPENASGPLASISVFTEDAGIFIKGVSSSLSQTRLVIENLAAVAATTTFATSTSETEEKISEEN